MKKRYLLAVLFISFAVKGYGQYVPLLNDSAVWRQGSKQCHNNGLDIWCDGWEYSDFKLSGDTLIGQYTYKKVDDIGQEWYNYAYVREDLGKVYLKYQNEIGFPYYAPNLWGPEKFLDTTEFVLYDFTLEVGDTFTTRVHKGYINVYMGDTTEYLQSFLLTDIDTVILNNADNRRIFKFTTLDDNNVLNEFHYFGTPLEWIEGIGSTSTFFYNETGLYSDCGLDLESSQLQIACYSLNDTLLWGLPDCQFPTGINEVLADKKPVIFPNPAEDILTIKGATDKSTYTIYTMVGSIVKSGTITTNQLDITDLADGTYIVAITDKLSGTIYRNKIVKY